MVTSCTDFDHPFYKKLERLGSKQTANFFLDNSGKNMKYVSLGESLDFISFGFMNGVAYNLSNKEIVKFINTWIKSQEPKIEYERQPTGEHSYTLKEISREYSYRWNSINKTYFRTIRSN